MPNREFLETYPLYRRFRMDVPLFLSSLDQPSIHMYCDVCESGQTFRMSNKYAELYGDASGATSEGGPVVRAKYVCAACVRFYRYFFLKLDHENDWVMKVGQEPPWEITPDARLAEALGGRVGFYKNGLVCESQSYGIGAFAYYRRVVEEVIDDLLAGIPDLLSGEERERYVEALEDVKRTRVTEDKIKLVKDLLPPILLPDGVNPLGVLHSDLSAGLHGETDEACLARAEEVRGALVFLVNQIAVTQSAGRTFTDQMRKLLEKRKK